MDFSDEERHATVNWEALIQSVDLDKILDHWNDIKEIETEMKWDGKED